MEEKIKQQTETVEVDYKQKYEELVKVYNTLSKQYSNTIELLNVMIERYICKGTEN